MTKLVKNIREAIELSGLKDGQTVSFHHHLRNGDFVLNMVMEQIADMGFHDLTVNASSLFDCHRPLLTDIENHVVTKLLTDYVSAGIGHAISEGIMDTPVEFITAHGRPDVMVVDPPRAGMHPDVVKVILEAAPSKIVYVSCNPASQARDCALLASKYKITAVQPVDMFPHTQHVENVCRLELL